MTNVAWLSDDVVPSWDASCLRSGVYLPVSPFLSTRYEGISHPKLYGTSGLPLEGSVLATPLRPSTLGGGVPLSPREDASKALEPRGLSKWPTWFFTP